MLFLNDISKKLLFVLIFEVSNGFKPHIIPDSKEMIINEGAPLEIICTSTRQIKIFYPRLDYSTRTKTSEHTIEFQILKEEISLMQWKFRRNNTIFGDTGWYGCADVLADIPLSDYEHPNASFIYVYVQSNTSGFTEITQFSRTIFVRNATFILPCRPTHPRSNVTLFYAENRDRNIEDILFDSKTGFFLKASLVKQYRNLVCSTINNGSLFSISYVVENDFLFVNKAAVEIDYTSNKIGHFIGNNSFMLVRCRIEVKRAANVTCILTLPNTDKDIYFSELKIKYEPPEIHETGSDSKEIIYKFDYYKINFNDMGVYTCTFLSDEGISVAETYVYVYDSISRISISYTTSPDHNDCGGDCKTIEGDNINLKCSAFYPCNHLMWRDAYMRPLNNSEKFQVYENTSMTIKTDTDNQNILYERSLLVRNVSKSDETVLICAAEKQTKNFQLQYFSLIVANPVGAFFTDLNLNNTEVIFNKGFIPDQLILKCFARGVPPPKITWYKNGVQLKNDYGFYLFEGKKQEELKDFINKEYLLTDKNQEILSIKYLTESANFSCVAKNLHGKVEAYQIFTVKDADEFITLALMIAVVMLLIIFFISILIRKKSLKLIRSTYLEGIDFLDFKDGDVKILSPDIMINDQVDYLRYDKKLEFNKKRLKLEEKLGSGVFGIIMKAEAYGICINNEVATVAVKMVPSDAEHFQIRALATELKIMVYLGKHLNIVNLLGACTKNIINKELLLILEYCKYGDLHNYLLEKRACFIDKFDQNTENINFSTSVDPSTDSDSIIAGSEDNDVQRRKDLRSISTNDLLSWAFQIARGMEYLSKKKVLHGNLAARNILLSDDNVVKLSDVGLLSTLYSKKNFMKKHNIIQPVKWMSIESIRDGIFSTESDIWSFGIVMWELFTLGEVPYHQMMAKEQLKKLLEGYRMEKPKYATKDIYNLMLHCWHKDPTLRITFSKLVERVGEFLEENVRTYYLELGNLYEDIDKNDSTDDNSFAMILRH